MKVKCANCNKEIDKPASEIKRSKSGNVYCSRSCSTISNNKLFKSGENHPNYKTGISFYRKMKLKDGDVCEECGINELCVLEIHHIDRDRTNNKKDNLKVLCANCHKKAHCKNLAVG